MAPLQHEQVGMPSLYEISGRYLSDSKRKVHAEATEVVIAAVLL
jgi:hypothetical protein